MTEPQDNATPVGAIAELQREAADLRRMGEVFLSMAERLHKRIEDEERRATDGDNKEKAI